MVHVVKLVYFHYREDNADKKIQFKTMYDDTLQKKTYHVIYDNGAEAEVEREIGNQYYKNLASRYPQHKALILIDKHPEEARYFRVLDHYEVRLGDEVCCTCDDIKEAREEVEVLREHLS